MKKYLLILLLFTLIKVPASAVVTPEQIRSQECIIQHGHSQEMSRLIDLQNSQINGVKPQFVANKTIYDNPKMKTWPVKLYINILNYIDPSRDNGKFMQNNTRFNSNYDDL